MAQPLCHNAGSGAATRTFLKPRCVQMPLWPPMPWWRLATMHVAGDGVELPVVSLPALFGIAAYPGPKSIDMTTYNPEIWSSCTLFGF